MKAVIYARYSSDNQREASIEGQIRECTAFAEKNGITVLRHYIDRAISAKTDNRPEFQNMIKDGNKKLFDMIIVWKLDRFARNRYDSARYKAQLKRNGIKVVSATEVISDGAEGIILESMLEGFAEYYSVDLSEKVVRGMTDNALKCMFNGGTLPMGYVIDAEQHFQIDPVTAPYILDAFKQYDEGATMTQIRDWLNEQGMKNTRGNPLTYNSVQHLLKNRRYIGEYQYRDILIPDGIPAIVPKDLFDRVQAKMEKNKKAPARHKAEDDYLLTTKLFCGYCGAYLCGESGTSRTGVVHHYYKCVSVKKKRKECHKKPVKKGWIEDLVVSETMKMIMDDDAIEAIVSMLMELQEQDNTNIPLYERQLQETNTKIRNLINAIQQGVLTKSTKESLEELEAAKEELETRLANEQLSKPPKISAEFMTFWLHRFRKLDVTKQSHRKMLIDTFINAIYLYDDKMLITFNYKDGTKKITFSEIQEASKRDASGSDLECSPAPDLSSCLDFSRQLLFSIYRRYSMKIDCVWEHNGNDSLLFAQDFPGAFTRGESLEIAARKMPAEIASYLKWTGQPIPELLEPVIVQQKESELAISDADSDVLFEQEKAPLTLSEYRQLKALALKSAEDFLALYNSIPEKDKSCLAVRKTFYGQIPRTANEMYLHTRNVNDYYFAEIGVETDHEGTIAECRRRGFELLEKQPGFLSNPVYDGSYGEEWSLRKLMRRFIWHDRIHAKAMYRMAVRLFGRTVPDIFHFTD